VIPDGTICEKSGIKVVQTGFQHTDMSDRGPDEVKASIQGTLDRFLDDDSMPAPGMTDLQTATDPVRSPSLCRSRTDRCIGFVLPG
jgi:hypothetical protein